MKKGSDLIAIKDKQLRKRVLAFVEKTGGEVTIADIIRAALEEKLADMERTGTLTIPAKTISLARASEPPSAGADNPSQRKSRRASDAGGS